MKWSPTDVQGISISWRSARKVWQGIKIRCELFLVLRTPYRFAGCRVEGGNNLKIILCGAE